MGWATAEAVTTAANRQENVRSFPLFLSLSRRRAAPHWHHGVHLWCGMAAVGEKDGLLTP